LLEGDNHLVHDARGFLVVAALVVSLAQRDHELRIATDLETAVREVDGLGIVPHLVVQGRQCLVARLLLALRHAGRGKPGFELTRRFRKLPELVIGVALEFVHVELIEGRLDVASGAFRLTHARENFLPLAGGDRLVSRVHGLGNLLAHFAAGRARTLCVDRGRTCGHQQNRRCCDAETRTN
jgi:hypothetical protein